MYPLYANYSNLMDKNVYLLYTYVFKSDGQVCTRCTLMCSNLMDKNVYLLYTFVFKSDGQVCTL